MPAQSPTLSPTLSAITAGLRGSSSGIPASILPDEVGADVGGLRVDAAAETREDGDQRAAEREPDQVVDRGAPASCRASRSAPSSSRRRRAGPSPTTSRPVTDPARNATLSAGLSPSRAASAVRDVRADRDVHPDEAGGRGEDRADQEADRGSPAELVVEAEQEERDDRDDRDRRVLLAEVRRGALLHGAGDLLHPLVAGGLLEQPPGQIDAVRDGDARAEEREQSRRGR